MALTLLHSKMRLMSADSRLRSALIFHLTSFPMPKYSCIFQIKHTSKQFYQTALGNMKFSKMLIAVKKSKFIVLWSSVGARRHCQLS